MIRRIFSWAFGALYTWVQHPARVLIGCGLALFLGLVLDGTLLHLWMLQKEQSSLESRIEDLQRATREMDVKLERAQDPKFIRLQAQERFELAGENELIFVFSDDEGNERELGL